MNQRSVSLSPGSKNPVKRIILIVVLLLIFGSLLSSAETLNASTERSAQTGDIVTINYTLLVDSGMLYYTTDGHKPAQYTLGKNQLLPDLETALIGMKVGERATITLLPTQAYGPYRPELIMTVKIGDLPEGSQPATGNQLMTKTESGSPLVMRIIDVSDTVVKLDANHPLAGKTLAFEIELLEIQRNTPSQDRGY